MMIGLSSLSPLTPSLPTTSDVTVELTWSVELSSALASKGFRAQLVAITETPAFASSPAEVPSGVGGSGV